MKKYAKDYMGLYGEPERNIVSGSTADLGSYIRATFNYTLDQIYVKFDKKLFRDIMQITFTDYPSEVETEEIARVSIEDLLNMIEDLVDEYLYLEEEFREYKHETQKDIEENYKRIERNYYED